MFQFMIAVLALLAVAFWVASGGSDFTPEQHASIATQQDAQRGATSSASEESSPRPTNASARTETVNAPEQNTEAQSTARISTAANFRAPVISNEDGSTEPTAAEVAAAVEAAAQTIAPDALRVVSGRRVNMRSGPSTSNGVVDTLTAGTKVELLGVDETGSEPWGELRVIETGLTGYMALRFLDPA